MQQCHTHSKSNKNKPITFYSFIVCPYAIRTRIVLEEYKLNYIYKEIDLYSNKHLTKEFIELNPMHKLPVLDFGNNKILYESIPCCEYLDRIYGDQQLISKCPYFQTRQKMIITLYDNLVTALKWKMVRYSKQKQEDKAKATLIELQKNLQFIAQYSGLTKRMKDSNFKEQYFWGKNFSLTDVGILPLLQQDLIIINFFVGKNLLAEDFSTNNSNDDLKALSTWFYYARQRESFQKSTYQVSVVPTFQESPLLENLKITNPTNWDFEKFYLYFVERKFLIPPSNL